MGETPQYSSLDKFPGSSSYSVVAPFAADIDITSTGSVKYTQFTTSNSSQMNRVSSFIRSQTGDGFYGTRMMVAEWNDVPEYQGSIVSCTLMFLYLYPFAIGSLGVGRKYHQVQVCIEWRGRMFSITTITCFCFQLLVGVYSAVHRVYITPHPPSPLDCFLNKPMTTISTCMYFNNTMS